LTEFIYITIICCFLNKYIKDFYMAYIHCSCGQECDEPTLRQAIERDHNCPSCFSELPGKSDEEILISLLERIEELEENARKNAIYYAKEPAQDLG
jgi:transcription initiation factor IIE alpha subunit